MNAARSWLGAAGAAVLVHALLLVLPIAQPVTPEPRERTRLTITAHRPAATAPVAAPASPPRTATPAVTAQAVPKAQPVSPAEPVAPPTASPTAPSRTTTAHQPSRTPTPTEATLDPASLDPSASADDRTPPDTSPDTSPGTSPGDTTDIRPSALDSPALSTGAGPALLRAAPPPASAAPPLAVYATRVRDLLARHKRYPERARRRGLDGDVVLRLRVTPGGALATAPSIERSSGVAALDREALRMARSAAPLPASGQPGTITISVPVHFSLPE